MAYAKQGICGIPDVLKPHKDKLCYVGSLRKGEQKFDRSGVYAYTQRLLAYNSNKIEGSTLTEEQTASLFDNGTLPKSDDYYKAKDVEEMNGHFLMFNKMLDTLDEHLSR